MPSVLGALKEQTTRHHQRAERAVNLMTPGLTPERYAAVLGVNCALHSALEPVIAGRLRAALSPDGWAALAVSTQSRLPGLQRDLVALGHRVTPPLPHGGDHVTSEAAAWGAAYVLEGSALGGQVVSRHLRAAGFPDAALHFYGSDGQPVGPRWRTFGRLLESRYNAAEDPARFVHDAVRAAQQTFILFETLSAQDAAGSF
ncbi:biliverdin-producing heme oxygenase (plasmid) [Deinococcus taeanensis]|uniref:biliverdin-producing heme oxygenase n=1 Tax=Deinococcus taeanensis TaxID=2737050 RepID=UPI001CDC5BCB|nr:biliverdin-producing heme oxygenase [Deinococcus taeanensis]UBV45157.1 biliverdin-producing heme oxygenase [Deinococcus taeanensis]